MLRMIDRRICIIGRSWHKRICADDQQRRAVGRQQLGSASVLHYVLVNIIDRLLRQRSMVTRMSDRPIAQHDLPAAQVLRLRVT